MKIIPAIDLIDGKCVRLSKGDFNSKTKYKVDPLEIAKAYEAAGIRFLHVVDLDGARERTIKNLKTLEKVAAGTSLQIDFGGGIRSREDLQNALNAGAQQITLGTIAVESREECEQWMTEFGIEKFILGADCLDGKIKTFGWLENSTLDVIPFIQSYQKSGIRDVICTDISKDGMLQGPSVYLYTEILRDCKVSLIASAGISSVEDLERLSDIGCSGAIIGKALYEGYITLKQLQKFL